MRARRENKKEENKEGRKKGTGIEEEGKREEYNE